MLHAAFVSRIDSLCALYSTYCIMLDFSMPHYAPILCAHPSLNCRATTYTHIAHVATALCQYCTNHARHYYECENCTHFLCICTLCNAKFSARTCTQTFFCAALKYSACTRKPLFFYAVPKFSTHTRTLTFFRVVPKFSACTSMLISCCAVPNFTYHNIFTVHHAFLVRPPVHIHLYAHQILVNSVVEIGAFS
jgi:hypothetical protein